jgi:Mg2+ and Co2+ transporter CorA
MSPASAHDGLGKSYKFAPSYLAYVEALCPRNPSLLNLYNFLSYPRARQHGSCAAALDFRNGLDHPVPRSIADIDYLPDELHNKTSTDRKVGGSYDDYPLEGRILIIEDLTKDVVELLGSTLEIDPLFFAMHLHTNHRTGMRRQTPDEATLPSRLVHQNYMNLSYHRSITCENVDPFGGRLLRNTSIDRKLVFLRSTTIGLVQHCASVIKFQINDGFWIGVYLSVMHMMTCILTSPALIIVDPPIGDTYFVDGQKDKHSHEITLVSKPFLGAYEDFLEPPKFSSDWSQNDRSRGGMMHELVDYWERSTPASFDAKDPTIESLAYYPLKIVAAEWVKYVAVMQYCIKQYEYQGDLLPNLDRFNMDLRELQGWRRRSMNSQQKINSVIRQLRNRERESPFLITQSNLRYLIEDFEVISSNIENAGRRLENMLPVVMSLVQVIDARHALAETANISRLTVLALVFVPLSYVSSLFSMNPDNMPGSPRFWIYFAVAVPVTILVFLIARPPDWIGRIFQAKSQTLAKRRIPVSHPTFKTAQKEKGIA